MHACFFLFFSLFFFFFARQIMYAVVTLQDSDEVMVAPSHWLSPDKKQSYWPPFRSPEKCMEAVQNRLKPETGGKPWEKLNISFHTEYVSFDKAKEGQKVITEQKERSFLLATGFPGILKRQRPESTQEMSKNPLPTPSTSTSTSRLSADDKDDLLQMLRDIKSTVQENSSMLKKLLKVNTASEAPSSSSLPTRDVKTSLNLPLRTIEDVARTENELRNATKRQKYVSQSTQHFKKGIMYTLTLLLLFCNNDDTLSCLFHDYLK
ncbi:hypothetical protein PO909_004268 [Leuciscus waleckii]